MLFLALMLGLVAGEPAADLVTVRATGDCPSASAVREKLSKLLGAAAPGRAPDVADVEVVGSTLAITLWRATGQVIGDKGLPLGAGCPNRAEAAAIVLAAWEAQLGDHAAAGLVPPVTPPALATAEAVPLAPPAGVARVSRAVGGAPAAARPGRWALSPGASLLASIDSADTALAATAELVASRAGAPFAFAASALFVAAHATAVQPGSASWRRFGLVADARRRWRGSLVWLDARAGVGLTMLTITGSGFTNNARGTAVDPGVLAAVRLTLAERPASPWVEMGAMFWPRRQTLDVSGAGGTDLPRVDALLGIGFSIERSP